MHTHERTKANVELPDSDTWVLTLAVLLQLAELSWAQTYPATVSHTAWSQSCWSVFWECYSPRVALRGLLIILGSSCVIRLRQRGIGMSSLPLYNQHLASTQEVGSCTNWGHMSSGEISSVKPREGGADAFTSWILLKCSKYLIYNVKIQKLQIQKLILVRCTSTKTKSVTRTDYSSWLTDWQQKNLLWPVKDKHEEKRREKTAKHELGWLLISSGLYIKYKMHEQLYVIRQNRKIWHIILKIHEERMVVEEETGGNKHQGWQHNMSIWTLRRRENSELREILLQASYRRSKYLKH